MARGMTQVVKFDQPEHYDEMYSPQREGLDTLLGPINEAIDAGMSYMNDNPEDVDDNDRAWLQKLMAQKAKLDTAGKGIDTQLGYSKQLAGLQDQLGDLNQRGAALPYDQQKDKRVQSAGGYYKGIQGMYKAPGGPITNRGVEYGPSEISTGAGRQKAVSIATQIENLKRKRAGKVSLPFVGNDGNTYQTNADGTLKKVSDRPKLSQAELKLLDSAIERRDKASEVVSTGYRTNPATGLKEKVPQEEMPQYVTLLKELKQEVAQYTSGGGGRQRLADGSFAKQQGKGGGKGGSRELNPDQKVKFARITRNMTPDKIKNLRKSLERTDDIDALLKTMDEKLQREQEKSNEAIMNLQDPARDQDWFQRHPENFKTNEIKPVDQQWYPNPEEDKRKEYANMTPEERSAQWRAETADQFGKMVKGAKGAFTGEGPEYQPTGGDVKILNSVLSRMGMKPEDITKENISSIIQKAQEMDVGLADVRGLNLTLSSVLKNGLPTQTLTEDEGFGFMGSLKSSYENKMMRNQKRRESRRDRDSKPIAGGTGTDALGTEVSQTNLPVDPGPEIDRSGQIPSRSSIVDNDFNTGSEVLSGRDPAFKPNDIANKFVDSQWKAIDDLLKSAATQASAGQVENFGGGGQVVRMPIQWPEPEQAKAIVENLGLKPEAISFLVRVIDEFLPNNPEQMPEGAKVFLARLINDQNGNR